VARDKVQTRLPADRAEEVYGFQEDRDISQAEAVRRLVYAGLEAVDEDEADGAEGDEDEADGGPETRTVVSGQHLSSLAQLIQIALTLAVFVIVAGGGI
jgi:hypothetical protein